MVTINNKEYRNLTEQVLANIESINKVNAKVDAHYNEDRVLADYGIRVVGKADTVNDLPPVNDYPGTFGDAYIVGLNPPYDFYIYTRPFEGETENQWLDIGLLAIEGPQGETGEQGPKGETGAPGQSTRWFSGQGSPYISASTGDQYLDTLSGDVYQYDNNWVKTGNIKGTPGVQGPRGLQGFTGDPGPVGPTGPRGEAGYSVVIRGVLTSESQLPRDTLVIDRDSAYVVEDETGRWLYFLVDGALEPEWDKVAFASGSIVIADNEILNTFDADTKVNAVNQANILYGTNYMGQEITYPVDNGQPGSIVLRNCDNTIAVPDPEGDLEVANKQYVDNAIDNAPYVAKRPEGEYDYIIAYISTEGGGQSEAKVDVKAEMTAGSIPVYQANGTLNVSTNKSVRTSAVNLGTLLDNLAIRCGFNISTSSTTILQILQAVGLTKAEASRFVGRIIVKPKTVSQSIANNNYGVGIGNTQNTATAMELELIFNAAGGSIYAIAKPWKSAAIPTIYSGLTTGSVVTANVNVNGMYVQLIPDISLAI